MVGRGREGGMGGGGGMVERGGRRFKEEEME